MNDKQTLWMQTSQYRNWTISSEKLMAIREKNLEISILKNSLQVDDIGETLLEFEEILRYFIRKIRDYAAFFALPYHVMATCIVVFKRFYLHYTILDYSPKITIPTILLFSCKIENFHLSLKKLVEATNLSEEIIKEHEFIIAQALMYNLCIHHPFIPLHAIFLECQHYAPQVSVDVLARIYEKAITQLIDGYYGDLSFIYTPAQLALSSFILAAEQEGVEFEFLRNLDDQNVIGEINKDLCTFINYSSDLKKLKKLLKKYPSST